MANNKEKLLNAIRQEKIFNAFSGLQYFTDVLSVSGTTLSFLIGYKRLTASRTFNQAVSAGIFSAITLKMAIGIGKSIFIRDVQLSYHVMTIGLSAMAIAGGIFAEISAALHLANAIKGHSLRFQLGASVFLAVGLVLSITAHLVGDIDGIVNHNDRFESQQTGSLGKLDS